jgi:hypothetical protein
MIKKTLLNKPNNRSFMMSDLMKFAVWTLLFGLVACSESGPTTASINDVSVSASNEFGQLRLEVSSLIGWGKVSDVKMTAGDTVELVATLEDNDGNSLPNERLFISSENGNFFTEIDLLTDNYGQVTTLLVAAALGKDRITITNRAGLSATLPIIVNAPDNGGVNIPTLEEIPGVVSWKTLAKVTLKNDQPDFHQDVKALNGKKVKVQGFMMPLENTEKQQHFLLSVNPPSCFFCLPADSDGLIEIYTSPGIEMSFEPIVVQGTFSVLTNDEMGMYYRMDHAVPVSGL